METDIDFRNVNSGSSLDALECIRQHDASTVQLIGQHFDNGGKIWELRPRLGMFLTDDDLRKLVSSYLGDYRQIKK